MKHNDERAGRSLPLRSLVELALEILLTANRVADAICLRLDEQERRLRSLIDQAELSTAAILSRFSQAVLEKALHQILDEYDSERRRGRTPRWARSRGPAVKPKRKGKGPR